MTQIYIDLANADGTLTKKDAHWVLHGVDVKNPLATFPGEISEPAARDRARDFLRGFAAGRQIGEADGRAKLQRQLRDLLGTP